MTKRLFLGIPLPEELLKPFQEVKQKNQHLHEIRWVPKENIHLTLCFLGDVDEESFPALGYQIQQILTQQKSFSLRWKQFCLAPNQIHTTMLWSCFEDSDRWYELTEKLNTSLRSFMVHEPKHKKQIPHATLARFKDPGLGKQLQWEGIIVPQQTIKIESCVLYASELKPEGSQYAAIQTFPFSSTK